MKKSVLDLCYMSIYMALAVVLEYVSGLIPFLKMPQGGSINLAVIPLVVVSYHLGYRKGFLTGIYTFVISFLLMQYTYIVSPMQFVLDYLLPVTILPLASLAPKVLCISKEVVGTTVVCTLRFVFTVLSGVFFWFPEGTYAGSSIAWINSVSYNFYYNFATLIVAVILVPIIVKAIRVKS